MDSYRREIDSYIKEKYQIEPELLPFNLEDYSIYRHKDTGKWFAVFIVKDRQAFGLAGSGDTEIVCFKIRDSMMSDYISQQPGYLRGFPSKKWNWVSAVLDGTVPLEDICRWLDESFEATNSKSKNKMTPLPKRE